MMKKPSCFDCQHATVYPGSGGTYWEPPEAECNNEQVSNELMESFDAAPDFYEEAADKCGHFQAKLIENCGQCGKEMNVPAWSWGHWGHDFDVVGCCSQECADQYTADFDRKLEEWQQYDD